MRRCLVLVIGLYVSVDLANPWMPGAFVFDPGESVDGLSVRRGVVNAPDPCGTAVDFTPVRKVPAARVIASPETPRPSLQTAWVVEARRAHGPTSDLASPGEDH
jgi:hypothetical protein